MELGKLLLTTLTVWNVGQGQWVTVKTPQACLHFDLGGERAPWKKIQALCGQTQNLAYLSHWDFDHIRFVTRYAKRVTNFCIASWPGGPVPPHIDKGILKLNSCADALSQVKLLFNGQWPEPLLLRRSTPKKLSANDQSKVYLFDGQALIPGDSTQAAERLWLDRLPRTHGQLLRLLVLGHHGSRTSTSSQLLIELSKLSHLNSLKQAVASARQAKYGHPHPEVLQKLKKAGVACLLTQDWGNIHFLLRETRTNPNNHSPNPYPR